MRHEAFTVVGGASTLSAWALGADDLALLLGILTVELSYVVVHLDS